MQQKPRMAYRADYKLSSLDNYGNTEQAYLSAIQYPQPQFYRIHGPGTENVLAWGCNGWGMTHEAALWARSSVWSRAFNLKLPGEVRGRLTPCSRHAFIISFQIARNVHMKTISL